MVEDKSGPTIACSDDLTIGCNIDNTPNTTLVQQTFTSTGPVLFGHGLTGSGFQDLTFNTSGLPLTAVIRDVNVELDITHPQAGDVRVILTSPNGPNRAILLAVNDEVMLPDCDNANIEIVIDDNADDLHPPVCHVGDPAYTGNVQSNNLFLSDFSDLFGTDAHGNWNLRIRDADNEGIAANGGTINSASLVVTYAQAPLDVYEFCWNTATGEDIPDNGLLSVDMNTISLPNDAVLIDLNLKATATHDRPGDIEIELSAPGTPLDATVHSPIANCTGENMDVTLDDEGLSATLCNNALTPSIGGVVRPNGSALNIFDGRSGNDLRGVWTANVSDTQADSTGRLTGVCMQISYYSPALAAPFAFDNCADVTMSYSDSGSLGICNEGNLTRTWTATDGNGMSASCTQDIAVRLNIEDRPNVVAPEDLTLSCESGYTADQLTPNFIETNFGEAFARPRFLPENSGYCGQLQAARQDLVFDDQPGCGDEAFKIRRRWIVIDWCDNTFGPDTIDQIIKVVDTIAPVITCPGDMTLDVGANCLVDLNAELDISDVTVSDNCDNLVDVTYFVTDVQGNVIADLANVQEGIYEIIYTASDNCGNESMCMINLDVEDNTPPLPGCQSQIRALSGNASIIEVLRR